MRTGRSRIHSSLSQPDLRKFEKLEGSSRLQFQVCKRPPRYPDAIHPIEKSQPTSQETMALPLQRRLPTIIPSRSASFIQPLRIPTVSPLRFYASSSSHSERKASKPDFQGRSIALGCLGVVGFVGLAFGASARSQQQAKKRDQKPSKTTTVVEDTISTGSNETLVSESSDESESSSPQQSAFSERQTCNQIKSFNLANGGGFFGSSCYPIWK